ncbi:hypothetical protein ACAH01_00725 [Halomicrobium sp. HM KBTZ05]|uniref:Uncharacterized protein n=1 Tax=Halomicrobium mukohataei TaxID=57705 RepID=A0A847UDL6_9EURY|nr:hypothetical protein [Halomicrobium mukohataei]NLV09168.1 hypothetical protein [Halomicrobium mukohataei]
MRQRIRIDRYAVLSAVLGIANVAVLLFARWEIDPLEYSDGGMLLILTTPLVLLGHFLLGAFPAYLLVRYRVLSPLVISGFLSWAAFVDRGSMEPFIGLYFSPVLHLFVLATLAVVGFGEFLVRDVAPYVSHDPLL